jgi:ABC-type lipoprotein release transport system permease subunit
LMRALGTSPRRIFLSILSGTAIALTGNFLGITSTLLTTISEETVEKTGLDVYYPRGEYKLVVVVYIRLLYHRNGLRIHLSSLPKRNAMFNHWNYK